MIIKYIRDLIIPRIFIFTILIFTYIITIHIIQDVCQNQNYIANADEEGDYVIVERAELNALANEKIAWPQGTDESIWRYRHPQGKKFTKWSQMGKSRPNKAFCDAYDKYYPNHWNWTYRRNGLRRGLAYGACCNYTIGLAARNIAKIAPKVTIGNGGSISGYKKSGTFAFPKFSGVKSLKRGDILLKPGHVYMYLGINNSGKHCWAESTFAQNVRNDTFHHIIETNGFKYRSKKKTIVIRPIGRQKVNRSYYNWLQDNNQSALMKDSSVTLKKQEKAANEINFEREEPTKSEQSQNSEDDISIENKLSINEEIQTEGEGRLREFENLEDKEERPKSENIKPEIKPINPKEELANIDIKSNIDEHQNLEKKDTNNQHKKIQKRKKDKEEKIPKTGDSAEFLFQMMIIFTLSTILLLYIIKEKKNSTC